MQHYWKFEKIQPTLRVALQNILRRKATVAALPYPRIIRKIFSISATYVDT